MHYYVVLVMIEMLVIVGVKIVKILFTRVVSSHWCVQVRFTEGTFFRRYSTSLIRGGGT